MRLKRFKALWGMTGTLGQNLERIAAAGYDGVEGPVPEPGQKREFLTLLEELKLEYIADIYTNGNHEETFRERLERAAELNPILINCHSGKDSMSWDEQRRFFEKALAREREVGIPVSHETHRGRPMFTPWATARLIKEFPELNICADFSHWVVVTESLLEEQAENVALAMERTIHIHGRVGFRHGPQVPDPAAPEYRQELEAHERWWLQIAQIRKSKGAEWFTFTPEFGPPGYMHTLPYTRQPLADLWDVCRWMGERFAARYEETVR